MKNSILLILALWPFLVLDAQFDQFAIGNLGGTWTAADNSISFTHSIGDLVGTGEVQGALLFNQGFPQLFECYPDSCKMIVATDDLVISPEIRLYPNPSNGQVYLEGDISAVAHYQVYSLTGKRLLASELRDPNLDLIVLPAGIYAVVFLDKRGQRLLTVRVIRR